MLNTTRAAVTLAVLTASAELAHAGKAYLCTNANAETVVGHAWLEFENNIGRKGSAGFYPKSTAKLLSSSTAGKLKFSDRTKKQWTVRWCYNLPSPTYNSIIDCVIDQNSGAKPLPNYQLMPRDERGPGTNCAGWAKGKLDSAGLNTPNNIDPQHGEPSPSGMLYNSPTNPPAGSTLEIFQGILPLSGPLPDYSANVEPPETDHNGLIRLLFHSETSFTGLTGLPVHHIAHPTVFADANDFVGSSPSPGQVILSGIEWGDDSSFDYGFGHSPSVLMTPLDVYRRSYEEPGTYTVRLAYIVENAAEIHTYDVVVAASAGGVVVHRRIVDPADYPAVPSVPYDFGSETFGAEMRDQ